MTKTPYVWLIRGIRTTKISWTTKYLFNYIFKLFFQLLKTSINWENFCWLTNEKFIFIAKSKCSWYLVEKIFGDPRNFGGLDATNDLVTYLKLLSSVKTSLEFCQIFVTLSEYLNFTYLLLQGHTLASFAQETRLIYLWENREYFSHRVLLWMN